MSDGKESEQAAELRPLYPEMDLTKGLAAELRRHAAALGSALQGLVDGFGGLLSSAPVAVSSRSRSGEAQGVPAGGPGARRPVGDGIHDGGRAGGPRGRRLA
ncbi:hypothetical protein GXW82_43425 [Streptacidiphilus sp. 4-A2]|nr:hypothetical protein [Streptacidiphilus sp. 4-A2]